MHDLVRRAQAYASLTPAERAVLRLLEGLAYVALIAAATAAAQYLAGPTATARAVNWSTVARVCVASAAVAILMALAKYFKAQGDPTLTSAPDSDPPSPTASASHGAAASEPDGASTKAAKPPSAFGAIQRELPGMSDPLHN